MNRALQDVDSGRISEREQFEYLTDGFGAVAANDGLYTADEIVAARTTLAGRLAGRVYRDISSQAGLASWQ